MFTGLVSHCLPAIGVEPQGTGLRLRLANPWHGNAADPVQAGESIAVSGCCLTALPPIGPELAFDLSAETLARTWFGAVEAGRALNLERSLRLSDRLGGHLVSGHVDGVGQILEVHDSQDGGRRIRFQAPPPVERYLIEKGSVAVDGISLTLVAPRQGRFDVAVIPATLAATSLGHARAGQQVHIEADMVGKWIEKLAGEQRVRTD